MADMKSMPWLLVLALDRLWRSWRTCLLETSKKKERIMGRLTKGRQ